MPVSYSPWLVALSVALAIQGSHVGLSFAVQVAGAEGGRQRTLLAGAALCLGLGVWTMHFVGMLAERVPFPVDYLVLPTLLSFLVCVIVVGAAVLAVSAGPPTLPRIGAAAVFMGLGIVTMHYVGMETLRACAEMVNSAPLVLAAAALAIAASGLALWLAFGGASHSLALSATVLGLAISGMHYTAMSGLSLYPRPAPAVAPSLSPVLLAVIVAIVAFMVSGGFLLLVLPERVRDPRRRRSPPPLRRPGIWLLRPAAPLTTNLARFRLWAAPARPRASRLPTFPSCETVSSIICRSIRSSRSTPTRITRRCSTARRRTSARFRSAKSSTGWTLAVSPGCTAATSSTWGGSSAPNSTATAARSSSPRARAVASPSVEAASLRSRLASRAFATPRNSANSRQRY